MLEKPNANGQTPSFWGPTASVLITVLLFFGAQFIASFFFAFLALGAGWDDMKMAEWFKASALPQFLFVLIADIIIVSGLYWFIRRKKRSFAYIGLSRPQLGDFSRAVLAYGCYMVAFVLITFAAKAIAPSLDLEQEQQLGFEANKGIVSIVVAGISLVVLPPLVEELLCRGFLYTGLKTKLKVLPSAIITSIIFAVAHLQFGSGAPLLWVAAIDTFVLSLVLVYLRETTGRLAAPMLLHMFKNAVAFSLLFIFVS